MIPDGVLFAICGMRLRIHGFYKWLIEGRQRSVEHDLDVRRVSLYAVPETCGNFYMYAALMRFSTSATGL